MLGEKTCEYEASSDVLSMELKDCKEWKWEMVIFNLNITYS